MEHDAPTRGTEGRRTGTIPVGPVVQEPARSIAVSEELAARLAAELGDGFVVSFDRAARPTLVNSEMPPTNPDPAAAFTKILDEELKLRQP